MIKKNNNMHYNEVFGLYRTSDLCKAVISRSIYVYSLYNFILELYTTIAQSKNR